LFTNPEAEDFHKSTPSKQKSELAEKWKEYMSHNACWISFYECKKLSQKHISQVTGEGTSTPGHKWKGIDGKAIESRTNFPPFQGVILENDSTQAKAIPLLPDTGNQLSGIDKRVQSLSEQINWTNSALRGLATQVYQTPDHVNPEQIIDLQVSTNTVVDATNHIREKVESLDSTLKEVCHEISEKQSERRETLEELGSALSSIGKTLTDLHQKKRDKPIPDTFLRAPPPMSINSPVYNPAKRSLKEKKFILFPPESPNPDSSEKPVSLANFKQTLVDNPHFRRAAAPDLVGKGILPEGMSYAQEWYQEWNIDGLSVAQIRQIIDRMLVAYKIMCMKGKGEVEACKSLIQCFTGSLSKWWETISSPLMLQKLEAEHLKDEQGYLVYHTDGTPMSNMIGALTTLILEH
jgi:hypothetical protein